MCKTLETLRRELNRARREAPGAFVGVNLMAAINHDDFEDLARVSIEEGASFMVQGAGISVKATSLVGRGEDMAARSSARPSHLAYVCRVHPT